MEQAQLANIYTRHREILLDLYHDALEEMHPSQLLNRKIQRNGRILRIGDDEITLSHAAPIYIIGSGKASATLAIALEKLVGDYIEDGIVLIPRGAYQASRFVQFFECDHPLPSESNYAATLELLDFITTIPKHAVVINLLSGGTSALLFKPNALVSVRSLQVVFELLLDSGATIEETNIVRKQFSEVHGGRMLALLKDVHLYDIILSDVPGNNPATIGSGPTTIDDSDISDALRILEKYELIKKVPLDVTNFIFETLRTGKTSKPRPGDDALIFHRQHVIGTSTDLAQSIALKAQAKGYTSWFNEAAYSDSTRQMAIEISRKAIQVLSHGKDIKKPALLIFHGESYVNVTGTGQGGRNQELALTAGISIEGQHKISMLSLGTDGKDGPTDAAGALVNGLTTLRARKKGLEPEVFLRNNDSYSFFKQTGDLVFTKKHVTNLMDIQLVLIDS
ncbi:DUF4147 domain-containing protein [bacterium]|nr:MAG: DUF4147 domain-containing protein [bacterium]